MESQGQIEERRKRLSMLRSYTLADLFTLANASCGTIAIFLCLGYLASDRQTPLRYVFILPVVALLCDLLDGYVARMNKRRQSVLGADLDSLADVISFGVTPAVIGYTLGLRGFWDVMILTYFVCCGISRLARFNVTSATLTNASTGKVKYFEGTPIPTSVLIILILAIFYRLGLTGENFWLGSTHFLHRVFHPFSILYLLSGSAMISTIKIPKL